MLNNLTFQLQVPLFYSHHLSKTQRFSLQLHQTKKAANPHNGEQQVNSWYFCFKVLRFYRTPTTGYLPATYCFAYLCQQFDEGPFLFQHDKALVHKASSMKE